MHDADRGGNPRKQYDANLENEGRQSGRLTTHRRLQGQETMTPNHWSMKKHLSNH